MQSYFPKALLFKEWRLGRWYLILGILSFSLGPLQSFVSTLSLSQDITRSSLIVEQNIQNASFGLPGTGFLLIFFSAGLALVSLSEFFRSTGVQLASEPIRLSTVLLTKFLFGIGIVVVSQMVTSLWVWGALSFRHVSGPIETIYGWWLICTIIELTFYSMTFVMVLVVRPIVVSIILMCAILVAPLFLAQWYIDHWRHYLPGGGSVEMNIPGWGIDTYSTIQDISPYGIIHYGMNSMVQTPARFTIHVLEPFGWSILAFFTVLWLGRSRWSAAESQTPTVPSLEHPVLIVIRAFSTLCAAMIVEHYVLHTDIQRTGIKIIVTLFLWLCCHLLVRSFMGYWENGNQGKWKKWKIGVVRGGMKG